MTLVNREATENRPRQPRQRRADNASRDSEVCPRCGRTTARIIGRSESFPVLYLRCDECHHLSVAPA
jgi:hypothetical protein